MADTDIANLALSHLGAQRIAALSDETENAIICRTHFETVRDSLLRSRLWKFALIPVELSKSDTAPLFGWECAYHLPADFLRVAKFNGIEADLCAADFRIEGHFLLTHQDVARIVYVSSAVNSEQFDANFVEALSFRLASAIAMEITQSTTLRDTMEAMAAEKLKKAGHVNAGQGRVTVISGPAETNFGRNY